MSHVTAAPAGLSEVEKRDLRQRWWAAWLQALGIIIGVGGSAYGVWLTLDSQAKQFNARLDADREAENEKRKAEKEADRHLRQEEIDQREKEYATRFYERQLALYLELADLTARIGLAATPGDAWENIQLFKVMLIGKVSAIASDEVQEAAWRFNGELLKLKSTKQKMPTEVRDAAEDLSFACNKSLRKAFLNQGIDFFPPKGKLMGDLPPDGK